MRKFRPASQTYVHCSDLRYCSALRFPISCCLSEQSELLYYCTVDSMLVVWDSSSNCFEEKMSNPLVFLFSYVSAANMCWGTRSPCYQQKNHHAVQLKTRIFCHCFSCFNLAVVGVFWRRRRAMCVCVLLFCVVVLYASEQRTTDSSI